ncbi:MAG: FAD-dependent oxidoreductase [Thermodesulfobacteriota bacterium]|nr:FAD-dependent oxidoreductase [Thermodesulfobacteriota bacterium]
MRLPLKVIHGIRKAVGEDFTVGICLCADEKFWGAITIDESRQFAQKFENTGKVDFLNVSVGTYYNLYLISASMHTPPGFTVELSDQIKKAVTLPVMAGYQITSPQMSDEILTGGQADLIGLVRPLICDPNFPKKAREERSEDIRYCLRDNKGCIGRINQSKALSCIQNPSVGYEEDARPSVQGPGDSITRSDFKKQVMVVGAGPAGLEAARVAGERGHKVSLYEREKEVGGQINLIKKRPGREGIGLIIHYLRHMLDKLQVPVITGVEITPEMILEKNPDAVIVATGSRPRKHPVKGRYGPPSVLNVWEVLGGQFPVGTKILFIDENGGHHATATVELLADQGKKMDMLTSNLFIGLDLAPLGDLHLTRQRLLQKGVSFINDVAIEEINENRVMARDIYTNEQIQFQGYDTIVVDMGNVVEDQLYRELKGQVKELYRVGDCVAPRGIDMAILEGRRVGERL